MRRLLNLVVAALVLAALPAVAAPLKVSQLPDKWRIWIEEEVYPLITSEQRKAFLELETDEQRTEFAERLWVIWQGQSGLGTFFRRTYDERLQEARNTFNNTTEDRARVLLLHGQPDGRKTIDCDQIFNPLEFWVYARIEGVGQGIVVLYYKPWGMGRHKMWDPFETRTVLYNTGGQMALQRPGMTRGDRPEWKCGDADEILRLLAAAEYWMKDITLRARLSHWPDDPSKGSESASARFLEFSTILPKGATPLDFTVSATSGRRHGSRVRMAFSAAVPRTGLGTTKVGETDVIQLDVAGEVSREGSMVDRFRYSYTFPAESTDLPIVFERELRPGRYKLRLKVEDDNSTKATVREIDFDVEVPDIDKELAADAVADAQLEKAATAALAVLALQGPEGEGISGIQRFTAMVGAKVAKVEFYLDGKLILAKNRPPFEVELDIGPVPRLATVTSVALDSTGVELDRKQFSLNVGRERFLVRLQPVSAADRSGDKVHTVATVNVPPDRKLEKLELYWNELLAATVYAAPFEAWLPVQDSGEIGYLRALAVLDDGAQAEDVQFVNAPQFLAGVKVEAVELPITVLDKEGKPVEGLVQADFEVFEDGVAQAVSHFSMQRELPIRVGLVIDTSGSMEKTLPEVQRVVLGFLKNLLRPRDRASILAFSERPALIEGFTADFGALERALIALRPERETAFYDAVVHGLFQFSGVRGRKAMIILTDGEDNASKMTFDKALDYAQRSGVTIYAIGIDLPITKVKARSQLSRLARMTGGEAFFLARESALAPVYEQINRELRSQYLIAFTSTAETDAEQFRKITVKLKKPELDVRTIAGYYPGG